MATYPKITFGIIALNGQPFLEHNLRALYPFAHQIIVVEGATKAAAGLAKPDGHSKDESFEMLMRFKSEQDEEHKLSVISAEDEGFGDGLWPEKNEMSQAYAKRATGDWLWQVDADEFYLKEDMKELVRLLSEDESISAVSFPYLEFFGGFETLISGQWHKYEHPRFHRLFKWGAGYQYTEHRPPTVIDEKGRDLRDLNWLSTPRNGEKKIFLRHYAYVLPKQAEQKAGYYANVSWSDSFRDNQRWYEKSYKGLSNPLFLGQRGRWELQWLEPYSGLHPEQIEKLRTDLESGKSKERTRATEDIEALLRSPIYQLLRAKARIWLFFFWPLRSIWKRRLRPLIYSNNE